MVGRIDSTFDSALIVLSILQMCNYCIYNMYNQGIYTCKISLFVCFYFVIVGKKLIEKKIYKMTGPMAQ